MFHNRLNYNRISGETDESKILSRFCTEKVFLFAITFATFCLLLFYHYLDPVISADGVLYIGMVQTLYETGVYESFIPLFPLWLPQFFMKFGMGAEKSLILINMLCASCMP